jgi:hypothetical protein
MAMGSVKDREASLGTLDDLKTLLSSAGTGPCLSVYVPLSNDSTVGKNPNAKQNELRWRECLDAVDKQAAQFGEAGREILTSVRDWDSVAPEPGAEGRTQKGKSVAVFRSPDVFQVVLLDEEVPERAVFGRQFYVRPLIKELVRDRSFYLLALSQKNTRLLHCTMHTSEEISLPEPVKTDFEEWMNQRKPDHNLVYNAMASGAQGQAGPSALAPKGADAEAKDEYLVHFFQQLTDGVAGVLKGKTEPLVVCAVEYQIPLYRAVNTYPHLAAEAVHGAPNGLKSGEMHARAIDALNRCYETKVNDALALWNHKVGGGASSRLEDVVTAAHDGRVLTLLVSDSEERAGVFDEASHSVNTHVPAAVKEDLVNDAAVQTLLHAGRLLVVPQDKMPGEAAVAAIFRF